MEIDEAYRKVQKSNLTRVEQIKELHEEIEELKKNNEQLQLDHTIQLNSLNDCISKMKKSHEEAILILEADFNEKLVVEYDRYQTLEAQTNKMQEDYESKLLELSRLRDNDMSSTTDDYNRQLDKCNRQIQELQGQAAQKMQEHETMIHLLEDNVDREIVELKTSYEKQLCEEREVNMHLRGQEFVTKKRFISFQRENDELKHQVHTLEQERQVLKQTIAGLQLDILQLKKEMSETESERARERDSIIQNKEKQIYDLERRNQVLKKYKTVHTYKITELQKQVEAKDRHIEEKEKKLNVAEPLVEELMTVNTYRERQLAEMGQKLNTTRSEIMSECNRKQEAHTILDRVRFDLHQASHLLQEPTKLKETVKDMYHKYCQGSSSFIKIGEEAMGFQHERMFQHKRFMRTVKSLKRQMYRDKGKQDVTSEQLDENSTLIVEINNLRRQLKDAHERIGQFENPQEVTEHLQMAVQNC